MKKTISVDDLTVLLEEYRKKNGKSKADVAAELGTPWQAYYFNWVKSGSLPKSYIDAALKILGLQITAIPTSGEEQ